MTQQLFEEMIGDPPPSTVDVETVIGKERRAGRQRRTVAVVAAATVVVGLLTGSRAILAGPGGTAPYAGPAATSTNGTAATERRLTLAVRQAVLRVVPQAQLSRDGGQTIQEPLAVTHRDCGAANPPRQPPKAYHAVGGVRVGEHAGAINFEIGDDIDDLFCGSGLRFEPTRWTESAGPGGERIWTTAAADGLSCHVVVERRDRSYVSVRHGARWPTLQGASMSLTIGQVTQIALDPAFKP